MKKYFYLIMLMAVSVISFSLTSCGDDDEASGISGVYYTSPGDMGYKYSREWQKCDALRFINGNTVEAYVLYDGPYWRVGNDYSYSTKFPYRSGWYYDGGYGNYTYTIVDNKIIISNGTILTIQDGGNTLVPDGSYNPYTKG